MNEKKPLSNGAILLGLVLIVAGALALLDNLNIFSFNFNLGDWWPLILVALGVVHLWNNRNLFDFSGLFLILLGAVFLLAELGRISWGDVWRWWPAVLILLGISIVFKRSPLPLPGSARRGAASSEDSVRVNNILAGSDRRINSREFKGGDISNVLGGTEIDLLEAKLAPGDWLLTVSSVLGGVEIRVPRDWRLEVQPTTMLGGIDDHTRQDANATGGKLVIKASALLGGVEIKN
jgi:predicted membrane protein